MHRCKKCDVEFHKKSTLEQHMQYIHKSDFPAVKKILILGGGFAGVNILRDIQNRFQKKVNIDISIVNQDNFFLFTPMLPEVASGMIHPRDISIPIRTFCKRAKFYQAVVSSIDLDQKLVTINRLFDGKVHALEYDILVLAMGSITNFFGNKNIEKHSFTIKTIEDAIGIRNHAINMLENAGQTSDPFLQQKLMTFTVVGGGFAGVETIGEINHLIRESAARMYPNINSEKINMFLVSSKKGILPEVSESLSKKAMKYLKNQGVQILTNTKAVDADEDYVLLDNGEKIPSTTLIWTGGVIVDPVISELKCEHGKSRKVQTDQFLRLIGNPNVFALGDCAEIIDSSTGNPYPPTAQHAIHQSYTVSHNLAVSITGEGKMEEFSFHSKGMMATIGKRNAIVSIFGKNLQGLFPWIIWRTYYVLQMPSLGKKIKVILDWTVDSFFKRDLTSYGQIKKKNLTKIDVKEEVPSLKELLFPDL
jgi:NADH:ubiquinone reductase (H+-translocating)